MKNNKINNLILIIYGVFLIIFFVGFINIFGSGSDWINQHIVFPEYFRNLFYKTGNLLPNFSFDIGSGQNMYNFSYYGLLSPLILISYLLPFVKMTTYIIIVSIILFFLTGILINKFLQINNINNKLSLILSLSFMTITPILYNFHHHIMFVWYYPFLILSLIGVDNYLKNKKSFMLIIDIFLLIMTNYYFSIPCLIVIILYTIYKLIKYNRFNKNELTKLSIRLLIPILMSCVILIPTIYTLTSSVREDIKITLFELIFPKYSETLYSSYQTGLSYLLLISPYGILISKSRKKEEIFLTLSTIIITTLPIFLLLLNGGLYLRGKVLLPFLTLFILLTAIFINKLKEKNYNYKLLIIISIIVTLLVSISCRLDGRRVFNYNSIFIFVDFIFTLIIIFINKKHKTDILFISLIPVLFISSIIGNSRETYISKSEFNEKKYNSSNTLLTSIKDKSIYRIDNTINNLENINYNYDNLRTTIYSSTYNNDYYNFYNNEFGNNIIYRNYLMTGGTTNTLFNTFMGVKYIVSTKYPGIGYEKVKTLNNKTLYKNNNAYPLLYISNSTISNKEYKNKEFPYNIETMLNNTVTKTSNNTNTTSTIEEYNLNVSYKYNFKLDKKTNYEINLDNSISKNKLLLISYKMNKQNLKDTTVTINGITNKYTSSKWMYDNKNTTYTYVISSEEDINKLNITMSKGTYKISDIKVYTMDYNITNYQEVSNLKINKTSSLITGKVKLNESSYITSSIPYDKGFKVYVDGIETKTEKVNTAFLGFKVSKGEHEIIIKYDSPGFGLGIFLSAVGCISLIVVISKENMIE